jgi:hypothetical protein
MLFDLKGKRRRVVQGTYLMLAVLMGGGLVLFGIGTGGSGGGILDAITGNGGGGGGSSLIDKQVKDADARLARNPRDETALRDLTRAHYQLAGQHANEQTGEFDAGGKAELAKAADAWQRYLALEPKRPDASLATLMVQAYDPRALNRPGPGTQAAEIAADANPSAQAYLTLAQFAKAAGQSRKSDLAGKKALDLAPKSQRSEVRAFVKQLKSGGGGAGQPAPPPSAGGGG